MLQQQHLPLFSCGRVRCVWFADNLGLVSKQLHANSSACPGLSDVNVLIALSGVTDNKANFFFLYFKLANFSEI